MSKEGIIVYSGGMDSTTLLYQRKDEIALAISFDYGSNHNDREFQYAKQHTEKLGIEHIRLNIKDIMGHFNSSLLNGAGEIPEGHYADDTMSKTVVPFRNGIMLSIAAGIAESRKLNKLFIANHFGDFAQYPDCTFAFSFAMSEAIRAGTSNGVSIIAPYVSITKEDIAEIGKDLVDLSTTTWSCYKADTEHHCGKCGTCVERIWALRNFNDTTIYEDKKFAIDILKEKGEW